MRCDVELLVQYSAEYAQSNLRPQVAFVLLKNLSCAFFERVWDNTMAAVCHPERWNRQCLGHLFLASPPLEVSSVDPKKGCSVTLVAAEEGCYSIPITQQPSDQGCLGSERELEAASSIRSLPSSSIAPSPKGFVHKIKVEENTT